MRNFNYLNANFPPNFTFEYNVIQSWERAQKKRGLESPFKVLDGRSRVCNAYHTDNARPFETRGAQNDGTRTKRGTNVSDGRPIMLDKPN